MPLGRPADTLGRFQSLGAHEQLSGNGSYLARQFLLVVTTNRTERVGSLQPCSSQSLCSSPSRSGGSSEFGSPGPTSLLLALRG